MAQTRIIAFCGITDLPLCPELKQLLDQSDPADTQETRLQRLARQSKQLLSPKSKARLASTSNFLTSPKSKRDERREKKGEERKGLRSEEEEQKAEVKKENKKTKILDAYANPINDGWFFSDFFLFHHLFRGLGARRLWLSSEIPAELIAKYREYQHGRLSDRRVVLNEKILSDSAKDDNFRRLERDNLLQDFLDHFTSECKEAKELGQGVLLIILAHGEEGHGIIVGNPKADPVSLLRPRHIEIIARETGVQLTLIMNGCYSGGWVYKPKLNATAMTAASADNESYAVSLTVGGRTHGSFWAAAVKEALIADEEKNSIQLEQADPEDPDPSEEIRSTAFAGLSRVIFQVLQQEESRVGKSYHARFASQDDEWEKQWSARIGIPPGHFRAQWEKLPKVAAPKSALKNIIGKTVSQSTASTARDKGCYGFGPLLSKRQAHLKIKADSQTWLASYPGPFEAPSNMLIGKRAKKMVRDEYLLDTQIEVLRQWLEYKFDLMTLATDYKKVPDLDYCDCAEFDFSSWRKKANADKQRLAKHDRYYHLVFTAHLFPQPGPEQGRKDLKQENYLAAAFVDCCSTEDEVVAALKEMKASSQRHVEDLTATIRRNRHVRETASMAFASLEERMRPPPRSMSPRNREPLPWCQHPISSCAF